MIRGLKLFFINADSMGMRSTDQYTKLYGVIVFLESKV
jgi:hypothetical protein